MEFVAKPYAPFILVALITAILIEAFYLRKQGKGPYPWQETMASFGVNFLKRGVDFLTVGFSAALMFWVYEQRLWTQEITGPLSGLVFFLAIEFCYYWQHRCAHTIRWFWATHNVHHSTNHLNISSLLRLGWTGAITGTILFYVPLVWIGYHPVTVFTGLAATLFYQIWLHTETIGALGPIEWIFNTPSHHRVHHARNPQYLDKNYGGVLIIYDRLFGTFEAEEEKPTFGLVTPHHYLNPFKIAFHGWIEMIKLAAKAKTIPQFWTAIFGRPNDPKGSDGKVTKDRLIDSQHVT